MSPKRQHTPPPPDEPLMRSLALVLPGRQTIRQHAHDWHQVVYVERGALAVEAEGRRWPVPPRCGLWVPAGVEHAVEAVRRVAMQTVYLPPHLLVGPPGTTRVLETTDLLRQLIAEVLRVGALQVRDRMHASLAALLAELVTRAPTMPLDLPLPRDPRAVRLARGLLARPEDLRPLAVLAAEAGGSTRTLERLFLAETALSVGRWRQRARLQHAVRRLAEGATVGGAALECGYESTSAFVAAFRRALGITPGVFRAEQLK